MSSPSPTVSILEEFQRKVDGVALAQENRFANETNTVEASPLAAPNAETGQQTAAVDTDPLADTNSGSEILLGETGDGEILAYARPGEDGTPAAPGEPNLLPTSPEAPIIAIPNRQQLRSAVAGTDIASLSEPVIPETDALTGLTAPEPQIDPVEFYARERIASLYSRIKHGKCRGGFGPKPKKINAMRVSSGDPYYIEIRMRQTPLMPVGHTYIAYGNLGPDGNPIDESLIMLAPYGGYAGAALASGVPMPGVLDPHRDDCKIQPEAAYRVSLTAVKYERLLRAIQKARAEVPQYLLFTYNCNHFASSIAKSVGIRPPANVYVPALSYLYDIIEANEGYKITDRFYDPRELMKFPAVPGKYFKLP